MSMLQQVTSYLLIFALTHQAAWGCSFSAALWTPYSSSTAPLFKFLVGKEGASKAGYIDVHGKIVISPTLSLRPFASNEFRDGLLRIGSGKYMDTTGRTVIDIPVEESGDFSEGLAAAKVTVDGEPRWGFIDTSGEFKIPPKFKDAPGAF